MRWWWLKGVRARHSGRREEALECFRRCEGALRRAARRRRRIRRRDEAEVDGGDRAGEEDKIVVVLPYCVVHPRIDAQVIWAGRHVL